MPLNKCCPCCNANTPVTTSQALQLDATNADLSIFPNGNTVNLCASIKECETLTQISQFRLVSGTILEVVYIGEDSIPVNKTVDLSGLGGGGGAAITVTDTNTIDLILTGSALSANINIDPASTAPVSLSAAGLRINCCSETSIVSTDSNTIDFTVSGGIGHNITAVLKYTDSGTVDLGDGGSGLFANVKVSTNPDNILTTDASGLIVDKDTVLSVVAAGGVLIATSPLAYDIGTGTLSITQSNGTTNGYLSSADWTIFNTKVSATRAINTTGPLQGGGNLSADRTLSITQASASVSGFLTSTDWSTFNNKVPTIRTISTTSPLSGGGDLTANRTLSISQASTSTQGYITAADWNIFNTKVNNGANVGSGSQIFKQKTGVNLDFRTLQGTAGQIVLTQATDVITLSIDPAFAGGGGAANVIVKDEGTTLTASVVQIDFIGQGITASTAGNNVTVNVPGNDLSITNMTLTAGVHTVNVADAGKIIFFDTSAGNITYNINPVTISGKKFILYTFITGSNTVTLTPTSGVIEGMPSYQPADRECITIYSNGVNLFFIAKN